MTFKTKMIFFILNFKSRVATTISENNKHLKDKMDKIPLDYLKVLDDEPENEGKKRKNEYGVGLNYDILGEYISNEKYRKKDMNNVVESSNVTNN